MSKERTLANIARTAYWTISENHDTFDRIAKAVEAEVLARLNKSEVEPVAGQELTHYQVLDWIKKYGSTDGLQMRAPSLSDWENMSGINIVHTSLEYRVAPKKVNDPDDPNTWEKGVDIFVRYHSNDSLWTLKKFSCYNKIVGHYVTGDDCWKYAKLATPEQIEAWKLIND